MAKRKGKYTVVFDDPPGVRESAAVGSKKESEGPLAQAFDDQDGGLHPDIGHDELFLQLVEIFVIDPGGEGNPAQPRADRGKNPHSVTLLS